MASSDNFKKAILEHLQERASSDALFAAKFNNPDKNIEDCNTYILNRVQQLGGGGFTKEEVFSMALHYYQEDNIEVGEVITNCKIFVNHHVELTEEEISVAKEEAMKLCIQDEYRKLHKKPEKPKQEVKQVFTQATLF